MVSISPLDVRNDAGEEPQVTVSPHAIVILVAGMVAAWLAAGSTGLLGHPLRHALTWFALAVALVAAWPKSSRTFGTWVILVGGVVLGLLCTASTIPAVNVLAVAVVLAAIAQTHRGLTGRIALIASLAVTVLGCFRFAYISIPIVWFAADWLGGMLGWVGGRLVGNPLEVGATFGGIDFLVLMSTVYAAWLICTESPRRRRAIWAAVAIGVGQILYLAALAYSERLLAALPITVLPPESDANDIGLWTWGNGLRTLIPWNLPLLAMIVDGAIVAVMVRCSPWLPVIEIAPKQLERQREKERKEEIPGSVLARDMLFRFGPVLLAVAATLLAALGLNQPGLTGKTIVVNEKGFLDWDKPGYDSEVEGFHGMLPVFVESLGGKLLKSEDFSEQELAAADVVLLLHPNRPWSQETLERLWRYVRRGGSLLVVADPVICEGDVRSNFNEVLQPTAMRVRYDTAVTRTGNWEQSYDVSSHPATVGIDDLRNRFGLELGSSIRVGASARPILVGRWGWSDPGSDAAATGVSHYNTGEQLGDLVLAAEQSMGSGRVVVLGGASPLQNEMLANAYPFVGRLLSYLANRPSNPQALWRQLLALAALVSMIALLALRPAAWQLMLTPSVMAVSLVCCTAAGYWSGCVLPDGRDRADDRFNNIAYIDASHLEAYSSDLWTNHGIAELAKTLMRHGYLPLLASDLTPERLERAGLLISIGPARAFSFAQRKAVKRFVADGGTFIAMVGAEEARPSAPLLADFKMRVPPSPVAPGEEMYDESKVPREEIMEPEPLGALYGRTTEGNWQTRFYAGWPVESTDDNASKLVYWSNGTQDWALVLSRSNTGGKFVVIGDTRFAGNENFRQDQDILNRFWRWLLSRVTAGQTAWNPPDDAEENDPEEGIEETTGEK